MSEQAYALGKSNTNGQALHMLGVATGLAAGVWMGASAAVFRSFECPLPLPR